MYVCRSVCEWVAKERILSSAFLDRIRLSGRSFFVSLFWHEDNTKSCAHINLCEGLRPEVGMEKDQGCWSVESKTWSRRDQQSKSQAETDTGEKDLKQSENGNVGKEDSTRS